MPAEGFKKLSVFVASPSDVRAEKTRLISIVDELNHGLADFFRLTLEVKEWSQVVPNMGRGQEIIFDQLPVNQWDVMIGILWLRYGMPSGGLNPDESGTHEEFNIAYECWKRTGKPRIMFYRCTRSPETVTEIDTNSLARINDFFKQFETGGKNQGLYVTYNTIEDFEVIVRDHLGKILMEYVEKEGDGYLTPLAIQNFARKTPNTLPRREPFFGRKKEIAQAMRALNPADRVWAVIIDGIGGIGKTALAVEVAYLCKEQEWFDTFVFVSAKLDQLKPLGIQETVLAAKTRDDFINEIARAIGRHEIAQLASNSKGRALAEALRGTKALLILDNLETLQPAEQTAIADFLHSIPNDCKSIMTSRRRVGEAAVTIHLERLEWEDARLLIENELDKDAEIKRALSNVDEDGWKQLYDETGGSPLALTWTIGLMRARGLSFKRALSLLKDGGAESDLNEFIYSQAQKHIKANERAVLGALSFFGSFAKFDALLEVANLNHRVLDVVLEQLRAFSLVDKIEDQEGQEYYALHTLTKRFVRADLENDKAVEHEMRMRFSRYWVDYAKQNRGISLEDYKAYDQLDAEWANLHAAATWLWECAQVQDETVGDGGAAQLLITLAETLQNFFWVNRRWDERVNLSLQAYEAAYALKKWSAAGIHALFVAYIDFHRALYDNASYWAERSANMYERDNNKKMQTIALTIGCASVF